MGENPGGRRPDLLIGAALLIAAAAGGAAWSLHREATAPFERTEEYACLQPGVVAAVAVPSMGVERCGNAARFILGGKMDLNTASEADLDLIPGVGPETARHAIVYRERAGGFKDRAEIGLVPEIGREARTGLETWTDVQ